MERIVLFLGLGFIVVVMVYRVQTIQRFRENEEAYLDRCVGYIQRASQQQQELLASLSADQRTLSTILEKPEIEPGTRSVIGTLRDQLEAELDILDNLRLGGREQAAEAESARAHDLRAQGKSPKAYLESLAKQKPGLEVMGPQNGVDPLLHAEAAALAAKIVEAGSQGW